jgi:hypothetical protein
MIILGMRFPLVAATLPYRARGVNLGSAAKLDGGEL